MKKTFRILLRRKPVKLDFPRVSLGCHVIGALLPSPDPYDLDNLVGGVCKRFAVATSDIDFYELRLFRNFVKRWCRQNLNPLGADSNVSLDHWLERTNYTLARKQQLRDVWERVGGVVRMRDYECKSFIKREDYPEFKEARAINSRSDVFKCLTGPYFKLIEDELYKRPEFIKHIPVPERPDYIYGLLGQVGGRYVATDHSAFEAHITSEMMYACEFQLYRHMMKYLPGYVGVMDHIERALAGRNVCKFDNATVEVVGSRMSGDMCTSLGNGFTNLMLMKYFCWRNKAQCEGVVEGDDGLFRITGVLPTKEQFASLGMDLKMEVHDSIATASFCGLVFDEEDRLNVNNPVEVVVKTGWSFSNLRFGSDVVLRQLLRAKALSLAYELPGCPITCAMARWLLRCTAGVTPRFSAGSGRMDWWEEQLGIQGNVLRADIHRILYNDVPVRTRLLVERLYGISVAEQKRIEGWFDNQSVVCPIPAEVFEGHIRESWVLAARSCVVEVPKGQNARVWF